MTREYSKIIQHPRRGDRIDEQEMTSGERSRLSTIPEKEAAGQSPTNASLTPVYHVGSPTEAMNFFRVANRELLGKCDLQQTNVFERQLTDDNYRRLRYQEAFSKLGDRIGEATAIPHSGLHTLPLADGTRWVFDSDAYELHRGGYTQLIERGARFPPNTGLHDIRQHADPFLRAEDVRSLGIIGDIPVVYRYILNEEPSQYVWTVHRGETALEPPMTEHKEPGEVRDY